jgi:hypothetical protein
MHSGAVPLFIPGVNAMSHTFILQNQDKLFFGKNKEWVDGYDANAVFKTVHKDEAVNQMFEITSKDYQQRVKVISCALNDKGLPVIEGDIMPAPLPKATKPPKAGDDLFASAETADDDQAAEEQEEALDLPENEADTDDIPDGHSGDADALRTYQEESQLQHS